MSWLQIVIWIVTNLPSLIDLVKKLLDLLHPVAHADQLIYKKFIQDAIESKDPTEVEVALHQCIGSLCPSDLVKE